MKVFQPPPPSQQEIGMGALAGICSGYLFKKVSKYAAATAIVGYIAIQGASQAGYIKVNWKKVNDKIEDMKEDLTDEISEIAVNEDTLVLENEGKVVATARRVYDHLKHNAATSGSFTAGLYLESCLLDHILIFQDTKLIAHIS